MNDLVSQYFTCSKPVKEYNTVEPKKDIKNKDGIKINLFLYNSITKIEIKIDEEKARAVFKSCLKKIKG